MPNARKHTQTQTHTHARARARMHAHTHTHTRLSEHIGAQIPEPVLHCTVNTQAQSSHHDEHVNADERSLELRRRVHLRKRTHLRACAHVVVRVRVCVRVCMSACACTLLTGNCSDDNSVRKGVGQPPQHAGAAMQPQRAALQVPHGIATSRMKSGLLKKNVAKTCMRMTAQEARVSIPLCARCAGVRASLARMPAQPKLSIMSSRFRQYGLKQTNPRPVITAAAQWQPKLHC